MNHYVSSLILVCQINELTELASITDREGARSRKDMPAMYYVHKMNIYIVYVYSSV